jgi:hypothetical protein
MGKLHVYSVGHYGSPLLVDYVCHNKPITDCYPPVFLGRNTLASRGASRDIGKKSGQGPKYGPYSEASLPFQASFRAPASPGSYLIVTVMQCEASER